MREAVGPDVGIGVDFHGRVHRAMAKVLARELEPYARCSSRSRCCREHRRGAARDRAPRSTPIALGERLYSRWDFKHVLRRRRTSTSSSPISSHAGGITETRKIAAMAEAYDVALAPHCPLGPIALAASLQLDACTPTP